MTKLLLNMTMSIDGYVAGPHQSRQDPLGRGGLALHDWAFATRSFRNAHGLEGGERGLDDAHAAWNENVGATIMGRNMFGPVRGGWEAERWNGWWGDDPPFHTPVFVLTHHPREPLELDGGTTFHFVVDGISSALARAREAADGRDVALAGGADTVQQFLRAGLVDELEIHVVPLFLAGGSRLFENLAGGPAGFELVAVESSRRVAHFSYRRSAAA